MSCVKRVEGNNFDYRSLHIPYICLEMSIEYYCTMLLATVFVSGVIGRLPY